MDKQRIVGAARFFCNGCARRGKGKKIILDNDTTEDQSEKEIYYRFDFEFEHKDGLYPRRGIEIFGFFHRVTVKNKTREMTNENGRINLSASDYGFIKRFNENYYEYLDIIDKLSFNSEVDSYKYKALIREDKTSYR